jgi:hypothetical protein
MHAAGLLALLALCLPRRSVAKAGGFSHYMNNNRPTLMKDEERLAHIRRVLWDTNQDAREILRWLDHEGSEQRNAERDRVYAKLLGSYSWYTLLRLLPAERLREALDDRVLKRIWPPSLRKRYEYARSILSGSTLSSAG